MIRTGGVNATPVIQGSPVVTMTLIAQVTELPSSQQERTLARQGSLSNYLNTGQRAIQRGETSPDFASTIGTSGIKPMTVTVSRGS